MRGTIRNRRRRSALLVALGLTASLRVEAEPCAASNRPHVVLRTSRLDAPFASETIEHLRRALAVRAIDLCTEPDEHGAATLDIEMSKDAVVLNLALDDAVTNKRLSRDIDVRTIPPDARPLVIAQAADELMRASWAELFVEGSPKEPKDVAPAIAKAGEPVPKARPAWPIRERVDTRLGLGGELFTTGHAQIGPDVAVGVWPWHSVGAVLRGGARASSSITSRYGSFDTSGQIVTVSALVREGIGSRLRLEVGPSLVLLRFAFVGLPAPGITAREEDAFALYVTGETRASVLVAHPFYVSAAASFGAPIRSARVIGGADVLHEVGGILFGGQIGAGVTIW